MARLLAIEWDTRELRAVVVSTSGDRMEVEQATAIPIHPEVPENESTAEISKALKAWLDKIGASKVPTMVVVGGLQVELHELSLPPAPADELPDLVRYQMQREVTSLDENTPLDYFVLAGDSETHYRILAAIIPHQVLAQAHTICHHAGTRLTRMALRPCATASLAERSLEQQDGVHLVIHPLELEVDIVAIAAGTANLIRTVRLPHGPDTVSDARSSALIREVRRTIASVRQQAGEQIVNRITICGDRNQQAALVERLGRELDLPTTNLDPRDTVLGLDTTVRDTSLEAGKFAPLIGILLDEVHATPQAFDFVNPRKRPKERSKTMLYLLASAAVLLILTGYGVIQYRRLASIDRQIIASQNHLRQLESDREASKENLAKARRIAQWLTTDVTWLDEMDRLSRSLRPLPLDSKEYPADEDIIVTQLKMNSASGGGKMEFDAVARTRDTILPFQTRLQDDRHSVGIMSGDGETDRPGYGWDFKTALTIEKPDPLSSPPTKPSPLNSASSIPSSQPGT